MEDGLWWWAFCVRGEAFGEAQQLRGRPHFPHHALLPCLCRYFSAAASLCPGPANADGPAPSIAAGRASFAVAGYVFLRGRLGHLYRTHGWLYDMPKGMPDGVAREAKPSDSAANQSSIQVWESPAGQVHLACFYQEHWLKNESPSLARFRLRRGGWGSTVCKACIHTPSLCDRCPAYTYTLPHSLTTFYNVAMVARLVVRMDGFSGIPSHKAGAGAQFSKRPPSRNLAFVSVYDCSRKNGARASSPFEVLKHCNLSTSDLLYEFSAVLIEGSPLCSGRQGREVLV